MVISNGGSALTIASQWETCWPLLVLHVSLGTQAGTWRAWREAWNELEPSLRSIAEVPSGPDPENLRGVIHDDEILEAIAAPPHSVEQNRGFMEAALRLDPSFAHATHRRRVQSMLEGGAPGSTEELTTVEPWASALAMASYLAARDSGVPASAAEWAWLLHSGGKGLDYLGPLSRAGQFPSHTGSGVGPRLAARHLCNTPDAIPGGRESSRAKAVEHLSRDGRGYTGWAHRDLARELAASGDPLAAWDTLADAAFYAAVCEGDAQQTSVDCAREARTLAAAEGWTHLESWLDDAAET